MDFQAIIDQVRTREPLDARQLDPEIPRDLNTICMKCTCQGAQSRFASAQEMADEFESVPREKTDTVATGCRVEKNRTLDSTKPWCPVC